jgi:hypothetical protein
MREGNYIKNEYIRFNFPASLDNQRPRDGINSIDFKPPQSKSKLECKKIQD